MRTDTLSSHRKLQGLGHLSRKRLRCRDAIAQLLAIDESSVKTGALRYKHGRCFRNFTSLSRSANKLAFFRTYTRAVARRSVRGSSLVANGMNIADQVMLRSGLSQACIISLICVSVTAPAIVISQTLPYFKLEALLVPVFLAIYAWLFLVGIARPIRFNGMFVIGFLFFASNAFSLWYGARILGHPVLLRDLYELPKVWLPVAFFTIAYEAALSESSIRRLLSFFSISILLVCVYAWSQFFGLGFTYKLNPLYSMGGHIDVALEYERRVYATVGNPNVLGELMTFCVVLFILAALFRVGSPLRNIAVAASCLITLAMTGSRYGLLNITFAFLLIFVIAVTAKRQRLTRVAVLLALLPAFAWILAGVAASNPQTLERYQTLKEPLQIDSLRERVEGGWLQGWSDFKSSPLFGHGPGKAFLFPHDRVLDSEYLNVLREKGSIGFLAFLGYYLYPVYMSWRGRQALRVASLLTEHAPAHVVCVNAAFAMGILALVMNIGMATFYSPFLQGFLWLWLGVGAGCGARLSEAVSLPNVGRFKVTNLQQAPA